MQYPIKSASLSRHASTSHHGRLLQDSGFTKRDSTPDLYENWEPTITSRQDVSSYQSRTVTGRLSFGRLVIPSIPKEAPSTSARAFPESVYTLSTDPRQEVGRAMVQEMKAAMGRLMQYHEPYPMYLPKTSYQRLRSELLAQGLGMPSWVHPLDSIPLPSLSSLEDRCTYGLTQTGRDEKRMAWCGDSYDLSALSRYP